MESDSTDIKWAIDLLSPDPLYKENIFAKYFMEVPALVVTPIVVGYVNRMRGLTFFSRPHYFLGSTAAMVFLANALTRYGRQQQARRDAVLRDYVKRHPEDFPPPERKKYGELFSEWVPIR